MPKENVERIKKAEIRIQLIIRCFFEGYAPHGIAVIVETATDNNNRTVANVEVVLTNVMERWVHKDQSSLCLTIANFSNPQRLDPEELELIN
jgi:hypothetical protein